MTPSPSDPPTSPTPPSTQSLIPSHLIDIPDPTNGRTTPERDRVATLAANIEAVGLLNPITLQTNGERFDLVAGLGRLLAMRQLGWHDIPATVHQYDDPTKALATLSENVTRSNLTPVDEALQLHTLTEENPEGTIGVAKLLGRSQSWVEDRLDILTWDADLIEHVHARRISLAAAKHLARIPDPTTRELYTRDAANNGISAATASQWRRAAETDTPPDFEPSQSSVIQAVQPSQSDLHVRCFGCNDVHELENTCAVRICKPCLHLIDQAKRTDDHEEQPRPTSPPTTHEPVEQHPRTYDHAPQQPSTYLAP